MFLLKVKSKARMFIRTTPTQYCTDILLITVKQEKKKALKWKERNQTVPIHERQDFLCRKS